MEPTCQSCGSPLPESGVISTDEGDYCSPECEEADSYLEQMIFEGDLDANETEPLSVPGQGVRGV